MNFKQDYQFFPRNNVVSDDPNLINILNIPELSHLRKWYNIQPDFELVKEMPDGCYETIQILLSNLAYATKDTGLAEELTDAFVIGNNGGDNLYVYIFNENYKAGIYEIDDVLDLENITFISDTLDDWLLAS